MAKTLKKPTPQALDAPVLPAKKTRKESSKTNPETSEPKTATEPITRAKKRPTKAQANPLPTANADRLPSQKTIRAGKALAPKTKKPSAAAIKKSETDAKKPRPKRKRKAKRPSRAEQTKILERRYFVWELYKAGASFRSISEHLNAKGFKASVGTVYADLKFCLALQHNELELDVKDHIANEVAVLDEIRFTFFPIMKATAKYTLDERIAAGGQVLNTVKEKAKLLGLYKPPKMNVSIDDELAKILGITPELLPDVDKAED